MHNPHSPSLTARTRKGACFSFAVPHSAAKRFLSLEIRTALRSAACGFKYR
jgi:hypothetical protein